MHIFLGAGAQDKKNCLIKEHEHSFSLIRLFFQMTHVFVVKLNDGLMSNRLKTKM